MSLATSLERYSPVSQTDDLSHCLNQTVMTEMSSTISIDEDSRPLLPNPHLNRNDSLASPVRSESTHF